MAKIIISWVSSGAFAVLSASPSLAAPLTQSECLRLWTAADSDANGILTGSEDKNGYLTAVNSKQLAAPNQLSRDEFIGFCLSEVFSTFASAPGAASVPAVEELPPDRGKGDITPGLRPKTEAEARQRLEQSGFRQIAGLFLHQSGVWYGQATASGKTVHVAVDPQGDISQVDQAKVPQR